MSEMSDWPGIEMPKGALSAGALAEERARNRKITARWVRRNLLVTLGMPLSVAGVLSYIYF